MAEDDMLAVQPLGLDGADKELGSVGVGPSIGHGENTGSSVLQLDQIYFLNSHNVKFGENKLATINNLCQTKCLRSAKIYGSTDPDPRGKISMLKKIRNDLDPDPFFSNADPGSRSASKLNGS